MVLTHTWVVDGDPCDVCDEMDGVTIEDGEEFEIDTWNDDGMPPVHPNCHVSDSSPSGPRSEKKETNSAV